MSRTSEAKCTLQIYTAGIWDAGKNCTQDKYLVYSVQWKIVDGIVNHSISGMQLSTALNSFKYCTWRSNQMPTVHCAVQCSAAGVQWKTGHSGKCIDILTWKYLQCSPCSSCYVYDPIKNSKTENLYSFQLAFNEIFIIYSHHGGWRCR